MLLHFNERRNDESHQWMLHENKNTKWIICRWDNKMDIRLTRLKQQTAHLSTFCSMACNENLATFSQDHPYSTSSVPLQELHQVLTLQLNSSQIPMEDQRHTCLSKTQSFHTGTERVESVLCSCTYLPSGFGGAWGWWWGRGGTLLDLTVVQV